MEMNQFLQIVSDQKQELRLIHSKPLCERKEEVLFELDSPLAQIVIGVRRSGKSTICHKVLNKHNVNYAYLNFDDERLYKLETEDLNTLLEALYMEYGDFRYLFLDEIQNVNEWFLFVNRLLRQGVRLFITGSNAKLLSSELATHLTGRYNKIELFPFSFAEYCEYKDIDIRDISTKGMGIKKTAFMDYMIHGGFPELFNVRNRRAYVQGLLDSIVKRDIQRRFKIKYVESLRMIANYLIDNFGQEIVYKELAEQFGLGSSHTAENYVSYLKQAFLLLSVNKFSYKSMERIRNEKSYVVDLAFVADREDSLIGKNLGWRLENLVYIELLRRTKPLFQDVYFYRKGYEIDFVVCEGNRVLELIQVSYDISSLKTYKREVSALVKGATELRCNRLTLITVNETRNVTESDRDINIVSIIDWLVR
ncbi:MAG: ATP-binding protein [Rikenellaceae bacterium]